jgi:hypothetical protein
MVIWSAPVPTQAPTWQFCELVHAWPHEPQLAASVWRLRQVPLQSLWPAGHAQVPEVLHWPPTGVLQAPEVRGPTLQVVPVPAHTTVPVCWQPPVPAEVHVVPVGRQ